ncbi:dienelactone hydrolase family protein [Bremerella sp. JC817]|uniref:dienelactone hydrolase family protein n=1 Tax=Bremerella sp. JC817 TaxID=3231756 RepID=UPI00345AE562
MTGRLILWGWLLGTVLWASPGFGAEGDPVAALKEYLGQQWESRAPLAEQPMAKAPLTLAQANQAGKLLALDYRKHLQATRRQELTEKKIVVDEWSMPFEYFVYGKKPKNGYSLWISMHGGGQTAKEVNDGQWENQKQLYRPKEGIYVAPRAPTDSWNMWHQAHIDVLFTRLIEDMIALADVDPNRVYIMGYSAGGDGVYQLAPRMSDQLAGAAMMAGHPNETQAIGLRNVPFYLQVGGKDDGFERNKKAQEFGDELARLKKEDPQGYKHEVKIYPQYGHWMNREDQIALPWLARLSRVKYPPRIVWLQDDVTHDRFYWLAVDKAEAKAGQRIVARHVDGKIIFDELPPELNEVRLLLTDAMLPLDKPVHVELPGGKTLEVEPTRTIATLAETLWQRGDPESMAAAEVIIPLN